MEFDQTDFERKMTELGIHDGALVSRVFHDGKIVYLNEHIEWMWQQYNRKDEYVRSIKYSAL